MLKIVCRFLAAPFAAARLKALITSRNFFLPYETREKILHRVDFSSQQMSDHYLRRNSSGQIHTILPAFHFFHQLKCCCR